MDTILKSTFNKSYYGKARVIDFGGVKYLKSYKTIVCAIDADGQFIRFWDNYSNTTQNHINDFRLLYGFDVLNKKAWDKIPVNNDFVIPAKVKNTPMKYKVNYSESYLMQRDFEA